MDRARASCRRCDGPGAGAGAACDSRTSRGAAGGRRPSAALVALDLLLVGSRFTFHRRPVLGAWAERRSTIADITLKEGRSGPLAFVAVHHRLSDGDGLCLEEEQDLVFRSAQKPAAGRTRSEPAPSGSPAWIRRVTADPVLLFRYSALTFNGHRIHYDRDFACDTEGYPGLIVHGPLLGLLMCQLGVDENSARQVAGYRFRLSQPIFVEQSFTVAGSPRDDGRSAQLWVQNEEGALAGKRVAALHGRERR